MRPIVYRPLDLRVPLQQRLEPWGGEEEGLSHNVGPLECSPLAAIIRIVDLGEKSVFILIFSVGKVMDKHHPILPDGHSPMSDQ